ncbi:MAG: hypothetical protein Q7U57_04970 [Methylovulum sp.]|nr:hypothetical protein [Methylovulum sp.]
MPEIQPVSPTIPILKAKKIDGQDPVKQRAQHKKAPALVVKRSPPEPHIDEMA